MADDGYIAIHRTTDIAEGELLAEMLRREGVAARFHRVSSALIGVPTSMIEMSVDVPIESEARAREILRDLEYLGADAAAKPPEGDGDDAEPEGARRPLRNPMLAAGFAFFLPGGGHLYARRPWTTLVLGAGVVGCFAVAMATHSAIVLEFALAILIATVACDAVAGVRAARAESRGVHRARGGQLAVGLGLLGAAIGLGGGARLATAAPRLLRTWQLSKYKVSCTERSIVVQNGAGRPVAVQLADLQIVEFPPFGPPEASDIGRAAPADLDLAPDARTGITVEVPVGLARSCGFWTPPEPEGILGTMPRHRGPSGIEYRSRCALAFAFAVSDRMSADAEPLEAIGSCFPRGDGSETAGRLTPR